VNYPIKTLLVVEKMHLCITFRRIP